MIMSLADSVRKLPLELKFEILLNLPYESIRFLHCNYFWYLYCKKYIKINDIYIPNVLWKNEYAFHKRLYEIQRRLALLRL